MIDITVSNERITHLDTITILVFDFTWKVMAKHVPKHFHLSSLMESSHDLLQFCCIEVEHVIR